jgi:hypothetical protein
MRSQRAICHVYVTYGCQVYNCHMWCHVYCHLYVQFISWILPFDNIFDNIYSTILPCWRGTACHLSGICDIHVPGVSLPRGRPRGIPRRLPHVCQNPTIRYMYHPTMYLVTPYHAHVARYVTSVIYIHDTCLQGGMPTHPHMQQVVSHRLAQW